MSLASRQVYVRWVMERRRFGPIDRTPLATRHSKSDVTTKRALLDGLAQARWPPAPEPGRASWTLRSRNFPATMRRPKRIPLVDVPPDVTSCCNGILTATAAELPMWQQIPFGTTAWRISYGRRQAVESANAALKGTFVDAGRRGFVRVFGLSKITLLLGFSIAGYDLDRVRSFQASHRPAQDVVHAGRRKRARRRVGTWLDVLGPTPEERADGPPQK